MITRRDTNMRGIIQLTVATVTSQIEIVATLLTNSKKLHLSNKFDI